MLPLIALRPGQKQADARTSQPTIQWAGSSGIQEMLFRGEPALSVTRAYPPSHQPAPEAVAATDHHFQPTAHRDQVPSPPPTFLPSVLHGHEPEELRTEPAS